MDNFDKVVNICTLLNSKDYEGNTELKSLITSMSIEEKILLVSAVKVYSIFISLKEYIGNEVDEIDLDIIRYLNDTELIFRIEEVAKLDCKKLVPIVGKTETVALIYACSWNLDFVCNLMAVILAQYRDTDRIVLANTLKYINTFYRMTREMDMSQLEYRIKLYCATLVNDFDRKDK